MPIPLLFIGITAVTGIFGVGKSIKAGVDQKDANRTNNVAEYMVNEATEKINRCRKNCGDAINNLGKRKIRVLNESIKPFIIEFEKLDNVDFTETSGLNELHKIKIDRKSFEELKKMQSMATSMAGGVATGAVAGAVTAFGAYGAAGAFATASTGTAIASLSGAAATNATLAFFGGGSLAAGGLGVAGGTAVLGGLIAGPALAVLGAVMSAKASGNKEKAYTNLAQAKVYKEEMNTASIACIAVRKRATMFHRILLSLNATFEPLVHEMKQIIEEKGTDYNTFSEYEESVIAEAMSMAGILKIILDTPILDESGNLTQESDKIAEETRCQLEEKVS